MYVPVFNAHDDPAELRALVAEVAIAQLVTVGEDGYPLATVLPVLWEDDRLVFHLARANQHWRAITPESPAIATVIGPDAYVSPSWYVSKAEHGLVVPTWNYSEVEFRGRATVREDPVWLRDAVDRLTDTHEAGREHPWSVDDAPASYVEKRLCAVVGVELGIEQVTGKAKLSQNRSEEDRAGVVAGMRADSVGPGSDQERVADAMDSLG